MNKTIDEEPFDIPQKLTENILHDIKFTLLQTQTRREDVKDIVKITDYDRYDRYQAIVNNFLC